jgi:hypothetical protein
MDATQRAYGGNLLCAITGTPNMTQRGVNLGPRGPQIERILETYVPDLIWEKVCILDYLTRTVDGGIGDRIQAIQDLLHSDRAVPLCLSVEYHPGTAAAVRAWGFVNNAQAGSVPIYEWDWPIVNALVVEYGAEDTTAFIRECLDRMGAPGERRYDPKWVFENRAALFAAWEAQRARRVQD